MKKITLEYLKSLPIFVEVEENEIVHLNLENDWAYLAISMSDFSISIYDSRYNYDRGNYPAFGAGGVLDKEYKLKALYNILTGKEL